MSMDWRGSNGGQRGSADAPRTSRGRGREDAVANALGWGSLGLGIPQLLTPGRFDEAIGVQPDAKSRAWTLAVGVREIAAFAGILVFQAPRPVGWLWGRVAGDAMDLSLLLAAWRSKRLSSARLGIATGAVVAIGITDLVEALRFSREPDRIMEEEEVHVRAAATIRRPRDEVYGSWRSQAPLRKEGAAGARIVEERPNELIAARTDGGAALDRSCTVRFVDAPGGRGTEIHVDLAYASPTGRIGEMVSQVVGGDPTTTLKDDLRRFKQQMETGVVVRSEGSPEGPHTVRMLKQRPAQPLEQPVGAGGRHR
jgi:uncharacterized membrane protein